MRAPTLPHRRPRASNPGQAPLRSPLPQGGTPLDTAPAPRSGAIRTGVATATLATLALTLAGCGVDSLLGGTDDAATDPTTAATGGNGTASSEARDPEADGSGDDAGGVTVPTGPSALCEGLSMTEVARLAVPGLDETSGLAPSSLEPGLFWAHNDSGNAVVLHGFDLTGAARAEVAVEGVEGVDIEDMAIADGYVYLADIGDNDRRRTEVTVFRFPEPSSDAGSVDGVESMTLRYPDRAHDAESLLVDPVDGTIAIIAKEVGFGLGDDLLAAAPAGVYTAAPAFGGDGVVDLTQAATIPFDELDGLAVGQGPVDGLVAEYGGAGVATGADVRADGGAIAVRTYEAVWLYDRPAGSTLAEALGGTPCEGPTLLEEQGEAVAFTDPGGTGYLTVSEGSSPAVNVARTG